MHCGEEAAGVEEDGVGADEDDDIAYELLSSKGARLVCAAIG